MLKKISIFWILLVALLLTSAVPLGIMAFRAIQSTRTEVEHEQRNQLVARVDAHASTIDQQFRTFEIATEFTAAQAKEMLLSPPGERLSSGEEQARLEKYQWDTNHVYGLDAWYETTYLPQYGDNRQSNVYYLNPSDELTPKLEYDIAVTEDLNPTFDAVLQSNIGTQWIYLTTAEGMMRLYPWAGNSGYGPDWEPQQMGFYTVADATNDPERKPTWTAPYNDCAGAGVMVTNAVPIYDGDALIAVMSHDMLIDQLQKQVLGFQVGKKGVAFLLDSQGNIIAHRDYAPEKDTPPCSDLTVKLADENPRIKPVVDIMLAQGKGTRDYTDANGNKWMVVFTQIPATGWHLGMMQPYSEIVEPATKITNQVLSGAILVILVVLGMSVWLARSISRPVLQLSRTAKEIEASVDSETLDAISPNLARLSDLNSVQEFNHLASVFEQMVMALQQRMIELNSIYAMGQTITSHVDFEQTLQAVLASVQQVVDFDAAEVGLLRGKHLAIEAWSGKEGFNNTTGREYQIGRGPTGMIAETKAPVFMPVIEGADADMKRTLGYTTAAGEFLMKTTKVVINSFLGIPLMIGDRLIGTLTLVHHESGHFTEADKRQLNKLAAQASVAIENAIQVRQRENALKAQIRELRVEIDQSKVSEQVEEITTSDYFQFLQANAAKMRERIYTKGKAHDVDESEPTAEDPKPDAAE